MAWDANPGVTLVSCLSLSPVASGKTIYHPSTFFSNVNPDDMYQTPSEAKALPRLTDSREQDGADLQ